MAEMLGFLPVCFGHPNWPMQTFQGANWHDKIAPKYSHSRPTI